jgi:hypothetical protein
MKLLKRVSGSLKSPSETVEARSKMTSKVFIDVWARVETNSMFQVSSQIWNQVTEDCYATRQ